ncbi:MAG TPA: C40 family peptidase [Chryseolinea sp.]
MLFFNRNNKRFVLILCIGVLFAACSTPKKVTIAGKSKKTTAPPLKSKGNDRSTEIEVVEENAEVLVEKEEKSPDKAEQVISTARTFIGTPYKYGGMTRSGMDCSGLLINSFTAVKVNLPRSSEAQSKVGTQVKMNELQPGDLVFFATGNKKNEITHVGLVTDVKGKDNVKFIHASSKLGVVETNLFAEYYQKRFRVARRVID